MRLCGANLARTGEQVRFVFAAIAAFVIFGPTLRRHLAAPMSTEAKKTYLWTILGSIPASLLLRMIFWLVNVTFKEDRAPAAGTTLADRIVARLHRAEQEKKEKHFNWRPQFSWPECPKDILQYFLFTLVYLTSALYIAQLCTQGLTEDFWWSVVSLASLSALFVVFLVPLSRGAQRYSA